MDQGNRWLYAANSTKGSKQPEPIRVTRRSALVNPEPGSTPGPAPEAAPAMDVEAMKAFFGGAVTYVPGV